MHAGARGLDGLKSPPIDQMPERPAFQANIDLLGLWIGPHMRREPFVEPLEADTRLTDAAVNPVNRFLIANPHVADPFDEVWIAPDITYEFVQIIRAMKNKDLFG